MSLTHVIPQEDRSTLEQLHYRSLLEPVDEKLSNTGFSCQLSLAKPEGKDTTVNVVPRINLNRLQYYLNSLNDDFKSNDCVIISYLYRVGLGLPKDKRLAEYWNCFSNFIQPVQDDNVIPFDDLMHVLEAHINQAKRQSWCGRYSYLGSVKDHFSTFSKYMYKSPIGEAIDSAKDAKSKTGYVMKTPSDSRQGFLVYKFKENGYILYGAWVETESGYAPFIRQVFDSEIPSSIKRENLKDFGTYLIIPGYFSFKDTVKSIMPSTTQKIEMVWDDCLDQDLFSHADFKPEETPSIRNAKKFLSKYRESHSRAHVYIEENAGSKDRNVKRTLKKAQALINRYAEYDETVKSFREASRAWNTLNPAKHLTFAAHDMFLEDPVSGYKHLKVDFLKILKKLNQCGFETPHVKPVSFNNVNKLSKKYLVRIVDNLKLKKLDIYDLWFGGKTNG